MTDTEIRDRLVATLLTPRSSRTFWDRWTNPDSFRGKMLALEDRLAEVQVALGTALAGPLDEVAALLRAWWASQPGMPYTAPSLWDASQMAADR
jgi:hypothetical protein